MSGDDESDEPSREVVEFLARFGDVKRVRRTHRRDQWGRCSMCRKVWPCDVIRWMRAAEQTGRDTDD